MKKIKITLLLLAVTLACGAKDYIGYGYLVAYNDNNPIQIEKTTDVNEAVALINEFTGFTVHADSLVNGNIAFEINTIEYDLYFEKKAVFKTKNGKLKYRKLTARRVRLINQK